MFVKVDEIRTVVSRLAENTEYRDTKMNLQNRRKVLKESQELSPVLTGLGKKKNSPVRSASEATA